MQDIISALIGAAATIIASIIARKRLNDSIDAYDKWKEHGTSYSKLIQYFKIEKLIATGMAEKASIFCMYIAIFAMIYLVAFNLVLPFISSLFPRQGDSEGIVDETVPMAIIFFVLIVVVLIFSQNRKKRAREDAKLLDRIINIAGGNEDKAFKVIVNYARKKETDLHKTLKEVAVKLENKRKAKANGAKANVTR